jgi:hypothetical protein
MDSVKGLSAKRRSPRSKKLRGVKSPGLIATYIWTIFYVKSELRKEREGAIEDERTPLLSSKLLSYLEFTCHVLGR